MKPKSKVKAWRHTAGEELVEEEEAVGALEAEGVAPQHLLQVLHRAGDRGLGIRLRDLGSRGRSGGKKSCR